MNTSEQSTKRIKMNEKVDESFSEMITAEQNTKRKKMGEPLDRSLSAIVTATPSKMGEINEHLTTITAVPNDEEIINQTILVCQYECILFDNEYECMQDKLENFCDSKIDDDFPPTNSFPAISKIHMTGSRSEKLWIPNYSDEDRIYEMGPCLVYPSRLRIQKFTSSRNVKKFFWEEAENIGHYRITDALGGYLYPQNLQMKLAPTIEYLGKGKPQKHDRSENNPKTSEGSTEAAIKTRDGNDHVLGLKLEQWPDSLQNQLKQKLEYAKAVEILNALGINNLLINSLVI